MPESLGVRAAMKLLVNVLHTLDTTGQDSVTS